ncbi:hypothetical protein BH09PSE6_BH09PSE6_00160 [soil metagenome]
MTAPDEAKGMKAVLKAFAWTHAFMALLFACAALMLIVISAKVGWHAIASGLDGDAALEIIEAIGLLAAAVVALQIAQTIAEEEVIRDAHVSAPTRVRRFLSRFFVVVIVALAIEGVVATFKAIHQDLQTLAYASMLLVATGVLLAGWGVFVKLNTAAEALEPEAMEDAKAEDRKVED